MNIGLVGLAGSGKDAAATELYKMGFYPASFADPLKALCRSLGWNGEKDEKGRRLLQEVGCAMRHFDPDYWVKQADRNYQKEADWVFTDVRFPNEAEMITGRRGILIRINRPNLKLTQAHEHESEKSIFTFPCHYQVDNDGSLEDLYRSVRLIVEHHTLKQYER